MAGGAAAVASFGVAGAVVGAIGVAAFGPAVAPGLIAAATAVGARSVAAWLAAFVAGRTGTAPGLRRLTGLPATVIAAARSGSGPWAAIARRTGLTHRVGSIGNGAVACGVGCVRGYRRAAATGGGRLARTISVGPGAGARAAIAAAGRAVGTGWGRGGAGGGSGASWWGGRANDDRVRRFERLDELGGLLAIHEAEILDGARDLFLDVLELQEDELGEDLGVHHQAPPLGGP